MSLLSIFFYEDVFININIKLLISSISFFLITSGLIASTIHLGHPERAWRALSQWRSSWLSREGIAAILTFFPLSLFYFFWIFNFSFNLIIVTLILSSLLSLITVFCTAKIYSSLKAIPAWNNPLVAIIYILNSLVLGSIITFTILFYFQIKFTLLSNFIIIISSAALFIKILYWYSIKKKSQSNISTATGLGSKEKTTFFEGPHSGKNYLTKEMINNIKKTKSIFLRLIFCILTYITPTYYILQYHYLVIDDFIISVTLIIISIFAFTGMLIERYLFFIESKHTVSLYYGNQEI